jgi:hypothetical protein
MVVIVAVMVVRVSAFCEHSAVAVLVFVAAAVSASIYVRMLVLACGLVIVVMPVVMVMPMIVVMSVIGLVPVALAVDGDCVVDGPPNRHSPNRYECEQAEPASKHERMIARVDEEDQTPTCTTVLIASHPPQACNQSERGTGNDRGDLLRIVRLGIVVVVVIVGHVLSLQ